MTSTRPLHAARAPRTLADYAAPADSMRAWVARPPFGLDALTCERRARPEPGATEVLVRVGAVALNYRDRLVVDGVWRPTASRVPASDGVGVVVAAGAAVTRVSVGERVAGAFFPRWLDGEATPERTAGSLGGTAADGMLAEYVVLDADAAVRVPAYLTDAEAATLPCAALTAWHALVERGGMTPGGVAPGHTVLVHGTGGVALFALQLARLLGADVLVTSRSDAKLERARALGARAGINVRATPDWEARVLEHTGGRGVDHVVETVGGANLDRSLRAARMGGTVSLVGMLDGTRATVDPFLIAEKRLRLHGILVGSRAMFERLVAFLVDHRVAPVIDRIVPFDAAPAALRHLASGTQFGKVCVTL